MTHTKEKWEVESYETLLGKRYRIFDEKGFTVCTNLLCKDAKRIVHCVNNYSSTIKQIEEIIKEYNSPYDCNEDMMKSLNQILKENK